MDHDHALKLVYMSGLAIAGYQMLLVAMICYVRFVIELFRRREFLVAVLFLLTSTAAAVAGIILGWRYARRWEIRAWVVVWSFALVAAAINLTLAFWLSSLTKLEWVEWRAWLWSS